jgi:hypothetical protein
MEKLEVRSGGAPHNIYRAARFLLEWYEPLRVNMFAAKDEKIEDS